MIEKLLKAKSPGDIFSDYSSPANRVAGEIAGAIAVLTGEYHRIAKIVHPDNFPDLTENKKASDATAVLNSLFETAKTWIETNSWGKNTSKNKITIGKTEVFLTGENIPGDICDGFPTEGGDFIKIPRAAEDNDLVKREAELLTDIWKNDPDHAKKFLPELKRTARIQFPDGERISNIFPYFTTHHPSRGYTLQEVKNKYPNLDLRHAAWIWRRLLGSLAVIHHNGWIHANILPSNFIIFPETHYGMLISFTGAVRNNDTAVIAPGEKSFYPSEVFEKKPLNPATDIYMAAKIMRYLLGKTPISQRINALLNACELKSGRLSDAWQIHEEFGVALRKIYGEPKFIEFKM